MLFQCEKRFTQKEENCIIWSQTNIALKFHNLAHIPPKVDTFSNEKTKIN